MIQRLREEEVQQCQYCCVFHQGEVLNNVQRITIILHCSIGPHASSNPDPETEDIMDAAITDKPEWNGENGRTESVIGLLFKDHYSEWNLNQKYDLVRQWENKNQDIGLKKKEKKRKLWMSKTSWREKQNRNDDHRKQWEKWKQTRRQTQPVWDGFISRVTWRDRNSKEKQMSEGRAGKAETTHMPTSS